MVIKSLAQTLKDLATGIKNTITGVTGSNATLTIIKGNGTTSTVTVNNVANATKATQDSAGQQINTTYIKGLSISGKTITYTKGDGTTGTITTQDTTYTHPNSGVTAGTYKSVTVNAQGHVTAGSNPTTLAGYGITDASLKGHTHSQYLTASSDLNVNKLKGVISLDNLPAGALERLVKVTNDTARFALTTNDIQLGDTVKVESTKMMYIVKDITKLNSEDGYEQYTAGMASSVPWSGVTGKPSSYTPSTHTHDDRYYTESEINSKVNTINSSIDTKADKTHAHDDRYYTESEIDSKLSTKSPLIGSTSLSKLSSNVTFGDGGAFSITQNDGSWWQRLRTNDNNDKTQKRLIYEESQGNSGSSYTELFSVDGNGNIYAGGTLLSKNGHTHDDRYYTESEMNTKLAGKSDTTHTHDNRYYTESEIDSKVNTINTSINNKSDKTHTHDDRYYTESEINTKLSGKSNTSHTHDDRYYTESEIDSKLAGKQGSLTATGSATKGMYIDSSGTAKAMTYSVNKDVPSDAKFTDTVYTHPTTAGNKHIPSGGSSGQILRWSADGTAVWGADNNTTYSPATQSANGLMSAADKKKLDCIATGANAYTHPNSGVTAGTYKSVTVNAQGHVTGGSNPTTLAGYGITDAPTKTGGGASGTWGINISGNSATATNAANANKLSSESGNNYLIINTTKDSWDVLGSNPGNWLKSIRTAENAPVYSLGPYSAAIAFGGQDTKGIITHAFDHPRVKFAGGNGSTARWKFTIGGGYNNEYYDLNNFPTKDGGGANGTWGINITGNATSATNADKLDGIHAASLFYNKGNWDADNWATIGAYQVNGNPPVSDAYTWGQVISSSTNNFRFQLYASHGYAGTGRLHYRTGYDDDKEPWNTILDSENYNNFAPTKTGGGASGTWGINISGNANTAGTADTSKACSGNSATATKATQDSAGQQINTTYIKGLSVSGKTITYTKGNGTTGTITTQDTVYTLPAASSSTLGGIKMSYGTNDLSAGSSSLATGALYFVYE